VPIAIRKTSRWILRKELMAVNPKNLIECTTNTVSAKCIDCCFELGGAWIYHWASNVNVLPLWVVTRHINIHYCVEDRLKNVAMSTWRGLIPGIADGNELGL
jgi:hypothetical protein